MPIFQYEASVTATVVFNVPTSAAVPRIERENRYGIGLEFLQSRFPNVEIVRRMPAIFTVEISGTAEAVGQAQHALVEENLAKVVVEDPRNPLFRAAQ
jgi:hypothetical protein